MKKIFIFGAGKIAEVVFDYFNESTDFEVVGFVCDKAFITQDTFHNLPVTPLNEVGTIWPATEFSCFVAIGYQKLNQIRKEKVEAFKSLGYNIISYISPRLNLHSSIVVGENCFIIDGVNLQPYVKIGDNNFVWSGATIGHHSSIGDNCWITSGACIAGSVKLGKNCFVAINATIANDVSIGELSFIGANALVTKDLENESVVIESSSPLFRLKSEDFLRLSAFH